MKKIVLLPLDERPCNYEYPKQLLRDNESFGVVLPPPDIMPQKKQAARFAALRDFLTQACRDAHCLVVSLDMLLYGGLVPSRLHALSEQTLADRLGVLAELKRANPRLTVYAFSLIMRCPQYSSDDEEPDYWAVCGKEMFELGVCRDKGETGARVASLEQKTAPYIDDFLTRRAVNLSTLLRAVDEVGQSVDFMVIPQDDSAPYGWTAIDQRKVYAYVAAQNKTLDCLIYPGADEVGLTLTARYINSVAGAPRVAVDYASEQGKYAVPAFEDRPLCESVKMQLAAAGCLRAGNEFSSDFTLMVNVPSGGMQSAAEPCESTQYRTERSLSEFVHKTAALVQNGVKVAVADVAYANGSDKQLVRLLDKTGVALRLDGYAGWNTSSNTLGTTIAEACVCRAGGDIAAHKRFLALRYFEDAGYCSVTRKTVCERDLPALGLNYFNAGEKRGKVAALVRDEIEKQMQAMMPQVASAYGIEQCEMPWKRMFEVGLSVCERKQQKREDKQ